MDLRTRLVRLLVVVLALGVLLGAPLPDGRAGDDRWRASINDARRAAAMQRKPILMLFLKKGDVASQRFEKSIGRDKRLQTMLDGLVCVKLDPAQHPDLVKRYHLATFPAALFGTSWGRPIKLMVGVTSTAKLRGQIKQVDAKFAKLMDPTQNVSKTRPRSPSPVTRATRRPHVSSCPTACEHCDPAIEAALAWLVKRQSSDGAWRKPDSETETKAEGGQILTRSIDHIEVSLTGVVGMALLAEGSTPDSGRHAAAIRRGASFLRRAVRPDGIISPHSGVDEFVYLAHSIFETSLAAMFLAEVQALQPQKELHAELARVARAIEGAQDERSGGWGYTFDAKEHPPMTKRGWRLLATTHCAMSALNAIRDAGVPVSEEVLERGVGYLESCLGRDGSFTYRTELRGGKGYPGATAGALYAIARSGLRDADALEGPRERLRYTFTQLEGFGEHWWFFAFFTGLAMNDRGEGAWDTFHRHFRDVLLENVGDDGTWAEQDKKAGVTFSTAIAAFLLQLDHGHPPIASRRTGETDLAEQADPKRRRKPRYVKNPHPASRVKVFEVEGGYQADLIVSVDGPTDAAYFAKLERGVRAANRLLWDLTDGQMSLHQVELVGGGKRADEADVLVLEDFYSDPAIPRHGGAHGITMVSRRTDLVGGRAVVGHRIGEWVKLPYSVGEEPFPWHHDGPVRVFAHELCHYLLGVQDEYGVGGSFCDCIVGNRHATELCGDHNHTDDRRPHSCWAHAELLYPRLFVPGETDPGPWDPPRAIVRVVDE